MQITARAITLKSLQLLKVVAANEAGDAADLDTCLDSLNDLLDSISLEPNTILSTDIVAFSVPAIPKLEYSIGSAGDFVMGVPVGIPTLVYTFNGVDYPLTQINEDQFASIGVKNTPGWPLYYWFTKGADLAYVDIWPIPTTGTFTIHAFLPMTEFVDLDTVYTAAPGYKNMLAYNLAVDVATMFETDPPKNVLLKAMNYKRTLKRSNVVVPIMNIDQVPVDNGGGYAAWWFQ